MEVIGDYAGAVREYSRALELDPENLQALLGMVRLAQLRLMNYPMSLEYINTVVTRRPDWDFARLLRAESLLCNDRYWDALDEVNELLGRPLMYKPYLAYVVKFLGVCAYFLTGQKDVALLRMSVLQEQLESDSEVEQLFVWDPSGIVNYVRNSTIEEDDKIKLCKMAATISASRFELADRK